MKPMPPVIKTDLPAKLSALRVATLLLPFDEPLDCQFKKIGYKPELTCARMATQADSSTGFFTTINSI
jgi:hypothetical protein